MNRIDAAIQALTELPTQFSFWIKTLDDTTYLSMMFVGAVALTFVIARALK